MGNLPYLISGHDPKTAMSLLSTCLSKELKMQEYLLKMFLERRARADYAEECLAEIHTVTSQNPMPKSVEDLKRRASDDSETILEICRLDNDQVKEYRGYISELKKMIELISKEDYAAVLVCLKEEVRSLGEHMGRYEQVMGPIAMSPASDAAYQRQIGGISLHRRFLEIFIKLLELPRVKW